MLQIYQQFYRETGVRRFSELLSPKLEVFKGFPRNAIYHHLNDDEEIFPDPSKPYFQGYNKRLPLELVYQSNLMEGSPRQVPFVPMRYVMPFIRQHRLFRYVQRVLDTPNDERTLAVIDYNPLKHSYRYVHTPISDMLQWESIQKTMWDNIAKQAKAMNKQHFVMLQPIKDIPSYNLLMNFGMKEGVSKSRIFNTDEKRFVLNLVNFLIPERRALSVMNVIGEEALAKINLIFMLKDGRCSTVNLAYLFSWVKGDTVAEGIKISSQYDDKVVIRALLKYLLVISASEPEEAAEDIPQQETQDETSDDDTPDIPEDDESNPLQQGLKKKLGPPPKKIEPHTSPAQPEEMDEIEHATHLIDNLDEELEILEQKNQHDLHQRGIAIKNKEVVEITPTQKQYTHDEVYTEIHTSHSPNSVLKQKLARALQMGDLNAASYKKALNDAEKYEKMNDPYGTDRKVTERTVIDPKALAIDHKNTELTDNKTVLDKSMTKSTLQSYTRDYVTKHLHNDVLKMVGSLQKGGVIIQKHEVTMDHTVMGSAELHNLELKPINGVASSVWFRLPVVEDDGTFRVAGNKYLMRKQRVDLNFC